MSARLRGLAAVLLAVFLLTACGGYKSPSPMASSQMPLVIPAEETVSNAAQIAILVTEEQQSSRLGVDVWNCLNRFAGEESLTCGTYKVAQEDALVTLELAVKGGARLVVLLGDEMADVMQRAQQEYSGTGIDFVWAESYAPVDPEAKTARVRFAAEEAGWLAGYAAVYEGFKQLGYMASESERAQRYGLGYILGADVAAKEMGLESGSITVRALHSSEGTERAWRTVLKEGYDSGIEVMLANDPQWQQVLLESARQTGGRMIGVGLSSEDQQQEVVLVNIKESLRNVMYDLLTEWQDGNLTKQREWLATVQGGDASFTMETAHFDAFIEGRYITLLGRFEDGTLSKQIQELMQSGEEGRLPAPEKLPLEFVRIWRPVDVPPAQSHSMPVSLQPEEGGSSALGQQEDESVQQEEDGTLA